MTADSLAAPLKDGTPVLSTVEQRLLGLRLSLSLIASGCLVVSAIVRIAKPDQGDVAELVAGFAAILVAVPALTAAWRSLRHPGLHGIMDQLIALALLGAWATGNLVMAALLPLVMTIGHVLEERSLLGSQEAIRALSRLTQSKARRLLPMRKIRGRPGVTDEAWITPVIADLETQEEGVDQEKVVVMTER